MRQKGRQSTAVMLVSAVSLAWQLTGSVASAADAAADSDSGALQEVVVTAQRREQNINDVPFSASALGNDYLDALNSSGDDIKQLASQTPSLQIESSNGRAFPRFYIRGYGNTDFHDFASQPVGLVYDDIVQENPALKGFPIFDQQDVEVLRGPQGTLFGRNSPAGVVKLESAKPVLNDLSGFVSLSDGTYNTGVFQGVINLPLGDEFAARVSVQGQHRGNWVSDPITDDNYAGFNDWAARAQLLWKPSDDFSALLNVHFRNLTGSSTLFRANIIQPGSNTLVPGFDPYTIYTDGPNSSSLRTLGSNLHLSWDLPLFTLQSITGYEQVAKYLALGDIDGGCGSAFSSNPPCDSEFPSGSGPGFIPFSVETSAGLPHHLQLTQEFRVISRNEGPLTGQAGVFLFYEDVTAADDDFCGPGECTPIVAPPYFQLQDTTRSTQKNNAEALFGSLDYKFSDALSATAGVRFTEDHKYIRSYFDDFIPPPSNSPIPPVNSADRTAGNVSWDVSATYKVYSDVNLYARIATGFRAPSFGEPSLGQGVQVVGSEKTLSYEGGVKAELWDHRARIALDGFYYDVSNQQLTIVGGGSADVTELISAKDAVGYGSELEFEVTPVPNLTFNFSGSLNYTRIEDPGLAVAAGGGVPAADVLNPGFFVNGAFGPIRYANINGNPLPEAARWVLDGSLRYDYPLPIGGKVYLYTDWSYRSGINFFLYEAKEFDGPPLAQGGVKLGYSWSDGKYDVAAFCRNCTNMIKNIYAIDFDNLTGVINDPRIFGGEIKIKF